MWLHFQLILVAYDLGQPVPYETTQPLQVVLLDIDDNEPVFLKPPVSSNYSSIRMFTQILLKGRKRGPKGLLVNTVLWVLASLRTVSGHYPVGACVLKDC